MQNGDTGAADIMVGNRHMWADHWDADVSCGRSRVTIRNPDDELGTMWIPIDWNLNHLEVNTATIELECASQRAKLLIEQDEAEEAEWDALHYRELVQYSVPVPKQ